jgi:hypothetical protein
MIRTTFHMRILFISLAIISGASNISAQDRGVTDSIVAEGKRLYRSEMASWYGTDIFVEKFKEQRNNLGGYFSYADNDKTNCVFYSNADDPQVIATVVFDSTYTVATAQVDGTTRALTPFEKDMYLIRKTAMEIINADTLFKSYKNTTLNLIPLIEAEQKKVYVLTGPQTTGVVIIGNDYLLTFDKNNHLLNKKQLHRNILPFEFGKQKNEIGGMHTHLEETGEYITATDICTLMLYSRFAKWKSHIVMSEKYISIWNCEDNSLVVMTKEAWKKINEDH